MKKDKIIYSTDPDWKETCPVCDLPVDDCICNQTEDTNQVRQTLLIKREKKGRGGKTVTTISGVTSDPNSLKKTLQQLCGSGGTYKNGIIEIQGDHRQKIYAYLQKEGFLVKLAGG